MSNCNGCPSKKNCNKDQQTCGVLASNPQNHIQHVICIMSGKGGVGKSTTTVLVAMQLQAMGYRVGIMDADITGPSIPRLLQLEKEVAMGREDAIEPVLHTSGIKTMSINYLLAKENQAVIWRGPMINGAIQQFWKDVIWQDLDYLLIDMPPGTGDVALTVLQSLPIESIIMVSTPQPMVSMIVSKAIDMAKKVNIPILGIIENMCYITCPDCGKKIKLHEHDDTAQFLKDEKVELLAQLPMLTAISNLYEIDDYENLHSDLKKSIGDIANKIIAN